MQQAFNLIRGYPTIGDFLAYQYVTDVNYSTITDFTEMEFVVPGPGAIDGIRKCFTDTGGMTDADVIRVMAERQEVEFERLGLDFQTLGGRRLQLIDCQNLFCEVGKYARVMHPEVSGASGRTRIKQKFRPNAEPIEYWYPPKWGINDVVVSHPIRDGTPTTLFTIAPEETMDLRTYQERARKTDRNPGTNEQARMIPLAGLSSETGVLLCVYKKYLRDGDSHKLFKERLAEEVGDLLWYVANVATKFDLDLAQVAEQNLAKCEGRWGGFPVREPFDKGFPDDQRLPRRFAIDFLTYHDADNVAKVRIMYKGKQFGDELTDLSYTKDGYGYHDVIHLAFAAILGWSPLVRRMLEAKRRNDKKFDQIEDGGRAIATEEGLSAMIFAYAREYNFLEGKSSVSAELLRMIKNMVRHLEVSVCTPGEWELAIVEGFKVWREVRKRRGGTVDLDLDKRAHLTKGHLTEGGHANHWARDRRREDREDQGRVGFIEQEMGRAFLFDRGARTGRRTAGTLPLLHPAGLPVRKPWRKRWGRDSLAASPGEASRFFDGRVERHTCSCVTRCWRSPRTSVSPGGSSVSAIAVK